MCAKLIHTLSFWLELFIPDFNVRTCSLPTCIGSTDSQTGRCFRFLAGEDAVAGGSIIRNVVSQSIAALEDRKKRCIDLAR